MKNMQLLPITETEKKSLSARIDKYHGVCGVRIEILDFNEKTLTIKSEQTKNINGFILTKKQLVSRAKSFFEDDVFYEKINVIPVTFKIDFSIITLDWVNERMLEFELKPSDLVNQLGIPKSSISLILSGKTNLSKSVKSCLYYYFIVFELNKELRSVS